MKSASDHAVRKTAKSSSAKEKENAPTVKSSKPVSVPMPNNPPPSVNPGNAAAASVGADGKKIWGGRNDVPPRLGEKPIPHGAEDCLEGFAFCMTGTLESITRDQAERLIKEHGGQIKSSVSRNSTHLLVGCQDLGASKIEAAKKFPAMIYWYEDDLLNWIKAHPAEDALPAAVTTHAPTSTTSTAPAASSRMSGSAASASASATPLSPLSPLPPSVSKPASLPTDKDKAPKKEAPNESKTDNPLWTTKYAPAASADLVGNKAAIDRIRYYLTTAQEKHLSEGTDSGKKKSGKQDEFEAELVNKKCILVGGPPGIGKTTSARIVAIECGYDPLEFNASDSRSKNAVRDIISESSRSQSLVSMMHGHSAATMHHVPEKKKVCLIMDEVDGMSGGDRGGLTELIQLIKSSKVPIICICNDLYAPKLKTLKNYAAEIKFQKPMFQSVRQRLQNICQREGIQMTDSTLEQIATSTNCDMRSILNHLQMIALKVKSQGGVAKVGFNDAAAKIDKDVSMSMFDAGRQLFDRAAGGSERDRVRDGLDQFFVDQDFLPLYTHENYIHYAADEQGGRRPFLSSAAAASDLISIGDTMGELLRKHGRWDLLPTFGYVSTVIPCITVSGRYTGQLLHPRDFMPRFPALLGKMSTIRKAKRMDAEICSSAEMRRLQHHTAIPMLNLFRRILVKPLVERGAEGIDETIAFMDEYGLTREDFDSIFELGASFSAEGKTAKAKDEADLRKGIETKVKAAFTRRYNSTHALMKRKVRLAEGEIDDAGVDVEIGGDSVEDPKEEDDNIDQYVVQVKATAKQPKKVAASASASASASKGKGRKS
nr:replication factor C subunit 1 [Andalucia godoyi]